MQLLKALDIFTKFLKPNNYVKQRKKRGRPRIYTEPTRSLSAQVPVSHYERLKTILEYELDKLKIKN